MGKGGDLVAGSGNEFVVIHTDDSVRKPVQIINAGICQICGEGIEILHLENNREFFVACNECAFPVCRTCYEYERMEGDQSCPQCKARYKRNKGSARVDGDEEEDEVDDLDHEFNFHNSDSVVSNSRFHSKNNSEWTDYHCNIGSSTPVYPNRNKNVNFPCITNGEEVDGIDHEALIVPFHVDLWNRVDQVPIQGSCMPFHTRQMNLGGEMSLYGYESIALKRGLESWKRKSLNVVQNFGADGGDFQGEDGDGDTLIMNEARQPLSRKLPIASKKINPYRIVIILRFIILGLFCYYRLLNPVPNAYILWLTSIICEICFAVSWIVDQFPKWHPVERETFLDGLSLRFENADHQSQLADIDIFANIVDPNNDHPLVTANAILSILALDYPADKLSCYVSDDGAALLTFEALLETSLFAKKWVPFCKKFNIEPRAPEWYFAKKIDYLKGKVDPAFVGERRAMKREYEEFKVRINKLVSMSQKVPEEGWVMQNGAPWPGNDAQNHPGMVQLFLGHGDSLDEHGEILPRLIYVSCERRPGFNHYKKAGAMNALVRVSGVLSNAPFILNVDCSHYINNSKALREAMCFMMDSQSGNKVCFVQFHNKVDGNGQNCQFSVRDVFFDINMKCLDGIQGPVCLGTGCVFRRQALYGTKAPIKEKPPRNASSQREGCEGCLKKTDKVFPKDHEDVSTQIHPLESIQEEAEEIDLKMLPATPLEMLERKFGTSPSFVASTLGQKCRTSKVTIFASALEETLQVISCSYEERTSWGKEVGWIYGSVAEDLVTGFKMHCNGWRSVYCMPRRPAFKGSAPTSLSGYLYLALRQALGAVQLLLSKHCPIWYGYGEGMKGLQRLSYISLVIYPWTAIPLITYCVLPAFCLLSDKFVMPEVSLYTIILFLGFSICITATSFLEMHWSSVSLDDYWRSEQFWVINGVSAHLLALFLGIIEVIVGIKTKLFLRCIGHNKESSEQHRSEHSFLLIPPMSLLILNVIGIVSGTSNAISGSYSSWVPLFAKVFFATWVIVHLYPCLNGLLGKQNRVPTIFVVWSILLASVCSILWIQLNPFISRPDGPVLEVCGLDCE